MNGKLVQTLKIEVNLIIDQFIKELNEAENDDQEQIRFRNLLMFVLSVNLPLKMNEFINFKYQDLFDENDSPKPIEYVLGRFGKDIIVTLPIKSVAEKVLLAYAKRYNLTYAQNANDNLFQSRKHQVLTTHACWDIIGKAAKAVGVDKNIGTESTRKTYGLNIYNCSADKLNAILFLGEIWGQVRDTTIIKYLNLTNATVDYDYYLGETFSLGNVDLSKINCLKPNISIMSPNVKWQATIESGTHSSGQIMPKKESVQKATKEVKTNRLWPNGKKLEVVHKYLDQHIPQKDLAKQYGIDKSSISRWVSEYQKYGETVFEEK